MLDSAIVALQSVGHTPLQHKEEVEINESEGEDDSLPLPDSPPPLQQRLIYQYVFMLHIILVLGM